MPSSQNRKFLSCALLASLVLLHGCGKEGDDAKKSLASANAYFEKQDYVAANIQLKSALQKSPNNRDARLLLGRSLLQAGDAAAAAIELRKALDLDADPNEVQPLLAKALLAQGNLSQVVSQFADVKLSRSDASAELKTTLATAFAGLGQRDRALEAVLSALSEAPQHVPATLLLARLKAAQGDVPGAMALVDQVLAGSSRNLNALLYKADLQRYGQQDPEAALATYTQILEAHPKAVAAHSALIGLRLERRELDKARAAYEQLKAIQPRHPETLLYEANFAYLDRNFTRARELNEQLLRVYPGDARVLQLAGLTELQLKSMTKAEAYLAQLVKIRPAERLPRQLLARIYIRTGQPSKGLEVLAPILESANADSDSLTLAGEALLQSGDASRAEAAFTRAARANPNAATARAALAMGKISRGNTAAGLSELEAAAAVDTGVRTYLALIATRLRSNDLPGALKAIADLEKKQPDSALVHALRGSALMQKRDTAGAIASFERALKIDPLFYSATAGLASIELAAGRPEGAQKRLEDVLRVDPHNTRALLGLVELKARTGGTKDEITNSITTAVKANPGDQELRLALIRHLLTNRDAKAALAAAQDAGAALPDNVGVMDALGSAQLAAGQGQQAVTTFTKLAGLRPDNPGPELRLADAYVSINDFAGAKRSLEKALQLRAGLPAQRALVQLALREKNPDEALRIAQGVQKSSPQQPQGFLLQADIELSRGKPDAAVEPLRKAMQLGAASEGAIKLHSALEAAKRGPEADRLAASWTKEHPRDIAFRYYLGDLALASKNYAEAETHYRNVIEVQPEHALALNNVAWLMGQQKRPGALALSEKANKLMPGQPALMDTLAYLLALENQPQRAVEVQKKALAQAPENPALRLTLAKIYVQSGDKVQARSELDTLAKLGDKFSGQAEVQRLLATL